MARLCVNERLGETVTQTADMLREEGGAQLLQTARRIVEGADDRFALGDLETEHLHPAPVTILQPAGEAVVVDQASKFEHKLVTHLDACQEHLFDSNGFGDAA